jgi:hypothetical protein
VGFEHTMVVAPAIAGAGSINSVFFFRVYLSVGRDHIFSSLRNNQSK